MNKFVSALAIGALALSMQTPDISAAKAQNLETVAAATEQQEDNEIAKYFDNELEPLISELGLDGGYYSLFKESRVPQFKMFFFNSPYFLDQSGIHLPGRSKLEAEIEECVRRETKSDLSDKDSNIESFSATINPNDVVLNITYQFEGHTETYKKRMNIPLGVAYSAAVEFVNAQSRSDGRLPDNKLLALEAKYDVSFKIAPPAVRGDDEKWKNILIVNIFPKGTDYRFRFAMDIAQ